MLGRGLSALGLCGESPPLRCGQEPVLGAPLLSMALPGPRHGNLEPPRGWTPRRIWLGVGQTALALRDFRMRAGPLGMAMTPGP